MFALHVREGLELALVERRHAPAIFARVDAEREYLSEWLPWPEATRTVADVKAFIDRSLVQFAEGNGFAAGIWLEGAYIGGLGLHYVNRTDLRTEIGYWLSREFTGRGIMTDCCRRIQRYAFDDLHLHRMELRCAAGNVRSRAVAERCGFALEGVLRDAARLHGVFHDMCLYGLLAR